MLFAKESAWWYSTQYFLRFLSLQRIFATDETIKVWCLNVIFDIIEILNGNIWQVSPSALSELFEKVDVSGDGTISIEEYVSMCETYGIKVTISFHLVFGSVTPHPSSLLKYLPKIDICKFNDADKERVREIADAQGEVVEIAIFISNQFL